MYVVSDTTASNGIVYVTLINSSNKVAGYVSGPPCFFGPLIGGVYDPANRMIYLADSSDGDIWVLNATTNECVSPFFIVMPHSNIGGIAFSSANNKIYVTSYDSAGGSAEFVSVISGATNSIVKNINVGTRCGDACGIAFDAANGDMYAGTLGNLTVINSSNTILTKIKIGPQGPSSPCCDQVGYDSANHEIYVGTCCGGGTAWAIKGTTVLGSISSEGDVWAFDPVNNDMYGTNGGVTPNVQAVDSATNLVQATMFGLASNNFGIGFDPANKEIFVSETSSCCPNGTVAAYTAV